EAIALPSAIELAPTPEDAAVVLAATARGAFPFLVTGERDGRRVACLGAAPRASSDDLPLLLLTLGTLAWLEERPGDAPVAVQTGVAVRVPGDPPALRAERVGPQRIAGRLVLANLFDDRESDIGRTGGGEWRAAARAVVPAPAVGGRHEVGWWLYL